MILLLKNNVILDNFNGNVTLTLYGGSSAGFKFKKCSV